MDAAIKRSVEIFLQRAAAAAAASLPAVLQGDCHIKTCEGETKKKRSLICITNPTFMCFSSLAQFELFAVKPQQEVVFVLKS